MKEFFETPEGIEFERRVLAVLERAIENGDRAMRSSFRMAQDLKPDRGGALSPSDTVPPASE